MSARILVVTTVPLEGESLRERLRAPRRRGPGRGVQAIEGALRTFPADELCSSPIRTTRPRGSRRGAAEEALARFDLPVAHVVVED